MKRCIISVLIAILVAGGIYWGWHLQQRTTTLTAELDTLSAQVDTLRAELTNAQPRVFEKEVSDIPTDGEKLHFTAMAGDRVVGEVSVTFADERYKGDAVARVTSPEGYVLAQTDYMYYSVYWQQVLHVENWGFPWTFTFIAPKDGEYILTIFSTYSKDLAAVAHLSVTCYSAR